tara:strand:+ start:113 stop:427 length:315 start_codon:yes stop_codon:yes gene_type:complete
MILFGTLILSPIYESFIIAGINYLFHNNVQNVKAKFAYSAICCSLFAFASHTLINQSLANGVNASIGFAFFSVQASYLMHKKLGNFVIPSLILSHFAANLLTLI